MAAFEGSQNRRGRRGSRVYLSRVDEAPEDSAAPDDIAATAVGRPKTVLSLEAEFARSLRA